MAEIWTVSCGRDEEWETRWANWRNNDFISIGYGVDFSLINENGIRLTIDQIQDEMRKRNLNRGINQIEMFAFTIQAGDFVVIKRGNRSILGLAKIIGNIEFINQDNDRYHQIRRVEWIFKLNDPVEIDIQLLFTRMAVHRLGVKCEANQFALITASNTDGHLRRYEEILNTFPH